MTCQHCAELAHEAAYLRDQLAEREDLQRVQRVREHYRIKLSTARVLLRLHAAGGRWVSSDDLAEAATGGDATLKRVRAVVACARVALGADHVENATGLGYRLSAEAVRAVGRVADWS